MRRVVVMFKVAATGVAPPGLTVAGLGVQVARVGIPVQLRATAAVNPDMEPTDTPTLVEFPASTLTEAGFTATVKSVPVPVRLTVCGLFDASLVATREPVRVPDAVGVKVTAMVQTAPIASELPQLLLWVKSPPGTMLLMLIVAVPVLLSVTDWEALLVPTCWAANVSDGAEKVAIATPCPVPSRGITWVLPAIPLALSVTVSVP